jgi:hypothetical protein
MYDGANISGQEKKSYVGDQKLRDWTKWFVAIHSVLWGKIQCFHHMI